MDNNTIKNNLDKYLSDFYSEYKETIDSNNITSETDVNLNKNSEEQLKNNDRYNISRRDKSSTKFFKTFVKTYKKNSKTDRRLKITFFVMFMIFLSVMIIIIPIGIGIISILSKLNSIEIITALIGSAATIITSIIIIPKIMAKYLFSSEETKISLELISQLLESDKRTREIHETQNDNITKAED